MDSTLTNIAVQLPVVAAFVFFVIYLFREFKELISQISADYKETLRMILNASSEREERYTEAINNLRQAIERLEDCIK